MSVYEIKSYLFPENVQVSVRNLQEANEIRRFVIQNQPNGIFENLLQKLQQAYGSLLPADKSEIRTFWKDEENELVGFSSDGEFIYALDLLNFNRLNKPYESSHPVFKVYVTKKSLIKTENTFEKREQSKQQQAPSQENVFHPGVTCDGCNGSVYGMRYKCKSCEDYDLCSKCHLKKTHSEHQFREIPKPFSFRCPFTNNRQSETRNDPFTHAFNNFMPMLSRGMPVINDPDQLKSVGEYLKAFLNPFGIDVDYYVEQRTKEREASKKTQNDEKMETKENCKEKQQENIQEENFSSNVQEKMNPASLFINSLIAKNTTLDATTNDTPKTSAHNLNEQTMEMRKAQQQTEEPNREPVKDIQKEAQQNVDMGTSAQLINPSTVISFPENGPIYTANTPNSSAGSSYAFASQALSQAINNLNISPSEIGRAHV